MKVIHKDPHNYYSSTKPMILLTIKLCFIAHSEIVEDDVI